MRRVRAGGRLLECVRLGADARKDRTVLISRVDHVPPGIDTFGFIWTRRQFSVRLAHAMTISMAQGQTLECAGVWLADLCFTHGQLYVAASRVGHPLRIRIALNPEGVTRNVVSARC